MTREDDAVAGRLVERFVPGEPGGPGCPDDNAWAAYLDGRLERRARTDLERHLLACTACGAVVTEARALQSGVAHTEALDLAAGRRRRLRWALAAAASVLVGTGVTVWALTPGKATRGPDTDPDGTLVATAAALRTARPDLFRDFEPVAAAERTATPPTRLRGALALLRPAESVLDVRPAADWVAAAGATGYEVVLGLDGGREVFRRTVGRETSLTFPEGVPDLEQGGKYVLRVEPRGPLGGTPAMRRFTVATPEERARLAEGLREIDRRAPASHRDVLRAQFALRRGFLLEAERYLAQRVERSKDDGLAEATLLYVRRRLGVPES